MDMSTLKPFEVEVETEEEYEAYNTWLRAKVQESLDNPGPGIPHAQVMAEIRQMIAEAKQGAVQDAMA